MRVVRFYAPGNVIAEESADTLIPAVGEVKIRVRSCTICGTDVKIRKYGNHRIVPPRVIGHEIAGEVVEVGPGVTQFGKGDRVHVIGAIPCGACAECVRGRQTVCHAMEAMGYHYDGGFADYMIVPAKVVEVGGVIPIPTGVGFVEASLAEPLACVVNGQSLVRIGDGALSSCSAQVPLAACTCGSRALPVRSKSTSSTSTQAGSSWPTV